jgi:hypothetical protein
MKMVKTLLFTISYVFIAGLLWATTANAAENTDGDAANNSVVPNSESAAASLPEGSAGLVIAYKGEINAVSASGDTRMVQKNDVVRVGDTIRTGPGAYVVIEFIDGAKATVRPDSELSIDRYAYETGDDGAVVNLIKGGLRAITGSIAKERPESYKVKTNVATLGVRGTEFSLYVCGQDNCE